VTALPLVVEAAAGIAGVTAMAWAAARSTRQPGLSPQAARKAAQADAKAGRWEPLIRGGWLHKISTSAPDPGNPGQVIAVFTDPHGLAGQPGGRVLIAADGTPDADGHRRLHAVPVPPDIRDPLEAAAWTYDDPTHPVRCTPAVYAALARRT
jgi:hypothetical protein